MGVYQNSQALSDLYFAILDMSKRAISKLLHSFDIIEVLLEACQQNISKGKHFLRL